MSITTMTSREFNQDVSKAKRAAADGPVFITDRGRPAHVLMTVEEFQKLTPYEESLVSLLAMPELADIDVEFEKLDDMGIKPADL